MIFQSRCYPSFTIIRLFSPSVSFLSSPIILKFRLASSELDVELDNTLHQRGLAVSQTHTGPCSACLVLLSLLFSLQDAIYCGRIFLRPTLGSAMPLFSCYVVSVLVGCRCGLLEGKVMAKELPVVSGNEQPCSW